MSGSGFRNQSADRVGAALTRYGVIVDNTDAFRSTHVQAMSVNAWALFAHAGVHHSAGQPDQADGQIVGGGDAGGPSNSSSSTPCASPGTTSWSGPTVDGGTAAGSFGFGVTSSGGRIARVHNRRAIGRKVY